MSATVPGAQDSDTLEKNLSGLLDKACAMTLKQFTAHIIIVFVVFAVNWNITSDWANAYRTKERAALVVLDELRNKDWEAKQVGSVDGAQAANQKFVAEVDSVSKKLTAQKSAARGDDIRLASRKLTNWSLGAAYLTNDYETSYDLDRPSQVKNVRDQLTQNIALDATEVNQTLRFQLPFLQQTFSANDRAFVLGFALLLSSAGLVLALSREWTTVQRVASSKDALAGQDAIDRLSLQQYLFVRIAHNDNLSQAIRAVCVCLVIAAIWFPVFMQLQMSYSQGKETWLADVDKQMFRYTVAMGWVFVGAIVLASAAATVIFRAIWNTWQSLLRPSQSV